MSAMNRFLSFAAGAAVLIAVAVPSHAQPARLAVGTLTCSVAPGTGFVFGSTRAMNCIFAGYTGQAERYVGEVLRYGVDIGFTNAATIMWAVVAGTSELPLGLLTGNYAGVSAAVTPGIGGAANVLIGGSNRTVSLQPVSVEGNSGLNIAAGIGEIRLR
jgi:hypothetical protein